MGYPVTRKTHTVSISAGVKGLRTELIQFEKKYGCMSDHASEAVKSGKIAETAEVAKWLMTYRAYRRLAGHPGHTTGSRTKHT